MSFVLQLAVIFISSVATTAQRNLDTTDCPANDGTTGACLPIIQCRRKMRELSKSRTPNKCFVRRGVRYVCCPVTSRPAAPARVENNLLRTNNAPPATSNGRQSAYEVNPAGCGKIAIISRDTRTVVGGREAKKHPWPWMAGIREINGPNYRFICGGSLITKRHVLTAAHCFGRNGRNRAPSDFRVVLGSHYRDSNGDPGEENVIIATPIAIQIHEDYKNSGQDSDITVLTLNLDVAFNNYVNSICLPTIANYPQETNLVIVIGWGHTNFSGSLSETLQEAIFEVVPTPKCRHLYRRVKLAKEITDNMLCAGNLEGGQDSCQYDSGGPLMDFDTEKYKWTQVGIVSFGYKCARPNFPGVYVKVSNFLPWIQRVVRCTNV